MNKDFVFEMRDELVALRQWAQAAYVALQRGVQLMPLDQIGQWDGVRAVIESAPDYCGDDYYRGVSYMSLYDIAEWMLEHPEPCDHKTATVISDTEAICTWGCGQTIAINC